MADMGAFFVVEKYEYFAQISNLSVHRSFFSQNFHWPDTGEYAFEWPSKFSSFNYFLYIVRRAYLSEGERESDQPLFSLFSYVSEVTQMDVKTCLMERLAGLMKDKNLV